MKKSILCGMSILISLARAADQWHQSSFEDESVVEYTYGECNYQSVHKLQLNLAVWAGAALIGPTASWYQPGMFKVAAGSELIDFSALPFGSSIVDSTGVTVKRGYNLVYHVNIPIKKGFEHGPHLAVNMGDPNKAGVAEYAAGYTWMWTKFAEWKFRNGREVHAAKAATQYALHLDALAFPGDGETTKLSSYGARLYVDGMNSVMGTDGWGLHYMFGLAYGKPYEFYCTLGFGLSWGFF